MRPLSNGFYQTFHFRSTPTCSETAIACSCGSACPLRVAHDSRVAVCERKADTLNKAKDSIASSLESQTRQEGVYLAFDTVAVVGNDRHPVQRIERFNDRIRRAEKIFHPLPKSSATFGRPVCLY